jgi:hypothetical protein
MSTAPPKIVCPHCHAEMETTGAFCIECGARLNVIDNGKSEGAPTDLQGPASVVTVETAPPALESAPDPPVLKLEGDLEEISPLVASQGSRSPLDGAAPPTLVPEDWMLVLTAMGHYAGVLRHLRMEEEREHLLRVYNALLKRTSPV